MLNRTRLSSLDAFGLRDQRNRIYPALEASDGSTLSLDFTQMSSLTSSGFTLSRATGGGKVGTATYINNNGYVATASANTPRFDYDPTTLAPRGLLIEGESTNLATRSDDFNTSVSDGSQWSPSSYTSGTLSTTLPDGTTGNARRISLASGSGSFRSQGLTVAANTAYTWSFWARNNGGSQARYRVWNVTAGSSIVDYTLSGSNYVSLIGGADNTSSTWVRVSVSFTTPAGCTSVYVYPCSSDSGTVDLLVWGAQLEAGSGASSYISTGSSTVTRAADKLSMTNISLMGWNQTAGTFLWDMDVQSETNKSSFPAFAGMYRAGPVRVIRFQLNNSSGTNPRIGSGTWTVTPSALVADTFYTRSVATPFKAAVAFANTGQSMTYCINGTVQSTVTGTGTLATPTQFLMHQDPSAADTEYFPIHLRQLKYWPTNLSSSDLRSITT